MSSVASTDVRPRLWRSRWAAIGAAVAVTFGGGGLFAVSAASPESSTVAIEPVRILDTRTDVGLTGPFVSPVPQDLKVTGSIPTATGTKIVVPAGATGVFLNLTPVSSTAAGFISVRPATATGLPTTSNVNFTVGAINPNAVLVELPVGGGGDDGKIEITFDAFGTAGPTTEVLVDVVGYTTDTRLKTIETKIGTIETTLATKANSSEVREKIADGPEVIGVQNSFVAVGPTEGINLSLPFSTNRTSRLAVSLTGIQGLTCASGSRRVWLAIDGTAVPNSQIFMQAAAQNISLTGVTAVAIPAGSHNLQLQNVCSSGSNTGSSINFSAVGTVTYISDAAPLSASLALDTPAQESVGTDVPTEAMECSGVLSADGSTCSIGD